VVEHIVPLTSVSTDSGFPSDHTLLVAALAAALYWLDRRFIPLFAAGTLLVMLGRLGVAAHHAADVAASLVIVALAAACAAALPLPAGWQRPAWPQRWSRPRLEAH
jgi:undecaprenyl-diphosphatase